MDSGLFDSLKAEARRIEEDALYSARGHFEAARGWSFVHYAIGVPTTTLAAIAGGSFIDGCVGVGAVLSLVVTALSAVSLFLNPSDKSTQHHSAGTRFNAVRNQARVFREIELLLPAEVPGMVDRVKTLGARRDELNEASPQIPRWAFVLARRGIKSGEASHAVDAPAPRAGGDQEHSADR